MEKITIDSAASLLDWDLVNLSKEYPRRDDFEYQGYLNWEGNYIGDIETISRFTLQVFKEREDFIHITSMPGLSCVWEFDDLVTKSLVGEAASYKTPFCVSFSKEKEVLIGYLCYRISMLANHSFFVPEEDSFITFTNDGIMTLHSKNEGFFELAQSRFGAFSDQFTRTSNKAGVGITSPPSASRNPTL